MRTLKILMWICSVQLDLTGRYLRFSIIFTQIEINGIVLFTRNSEFLSSQFLEDKVGVKRIKW